MFRVRSRDTNTRLTDGNDVFYDFFGQPGVVITLL